MADESSRPHPPNSSDMLNPPPTVPLPSDHQIESALLTFVAERGHTASACPSEVARQLRPESWRELMPSIRRIASELAQNRRLEITQRGLQISPSEPFKGPIRIRMAK